jgi:dTDP-4-amino-4,6-dideoxygalactose transaminase
MFGIAGSFSFYPGKNLGAYGDAGGIITSDPVLAERMTMYARHGALVKHKHKMEGINSRLDSLQASILTVKLNHILDWTKKRRENAEKITQLLAGTGDVVVPAVRKDSEHSFHLYVIQTGHRDQLAVWLKEKGIETSVHYPTPLPLLEAYDYLQHKPEDFPVAHEMSKRILSLPLYPELSDEQIAYMVNSIKEFFQTQIVD